MVNEGIKEVVKVVGKEGVKKVLIFGMEAKGLAVGFATGVVATIGGSKIVKAVKPKFKNFCEKRKQQIDKIVEEAKKARDERKKE